MVAIPHWIERQMNWINTQCRDIYLEGETMWHIEYYGRSVGFKVLVYSKKNRKNRSLCHGGMTKGVVRCCVKRCG